MSDDEAAATLRRLSDEADRILMRQTSPLPPEVAQLLQRLAEAGR